MLKEVVMDVVKYGGTAVALSSTGIVDKILPLDQNSFIQRSAFSGTALSVSNDIVDYFSTGQSKLLSGKFWDFLDDVAFMTVVQGAVDVTEIGKKTFDAINPINVTGNKMVTNALVNGGIVVGAKWASNFIERSPDVPAQLKLLIHPSKYFIHA